MWDLSSAFVKSSIKVPHEHVASQSTDSAASSDIQVPPEPVAHIPRQEPPSPIIKQTLDFGHTALSSPPSYGVVEDTWSTTVTTEVRRREGDGMGGERRGDGTGEGRGGEGMGCEGRGEGRGWDGLGLGLERDVCSHAVCFGLASTAGRELRGRCEGE